MKIAIKGFSADSDVDFVLTPETEAERALVLALRGRDALICYPSPNPTSAVTLRTQVDGARS